MNSFFISSFGCVELVHSCIILVPIVPILFWDDLKCQLLTSIFFNFDLEVYIILGLLQKPVPMNHSHMECHPGATAKDIPECRHGQPYLTLKPQVQKDLHGYPSLKS
uniref:Uncharacterized protein n=1 Tax=Eutreptiella gymnastica TaxID=73025 RepID=A0A7S1N133_9EUGL